MELSEILWWLVAIGITLVGLAGAVLPMLPGLPFVFMGMLVGAWIDDFSRVGTVTLVVLGVLLAIGLALDFVAGSLGAKKVGASPKAITGALVGSIVGVFFGLPGLILGPFVGAALGEIGARRGLRQATASGVGAFVGLLLGTLAKVGISVAMLGVFAFAWFV
jgi:uncharacterized protein YqgC (DUF456 family)